MSLTLLDVLSGFLMTLIMHDSYGYDINGLKRYALNRFLRLYPIYWAIAILSIITVVLVTSEYSRAYKNVLYIPNTIKDVIYNTTMIFPSLFSWNVEPRLSPPTWAITVELFFYISIAFGISKNKKRTLLWVGLSIIYYIASYVIELNGSHRYGSIFAASLPFSVGALLFFYKKEFLSIAQKLQLSSPIIILFIYLINAVIFMLHDHFMPFSFSIYLNEIGKYSNILLSLFVVTSLFYRGEEVFPKKLDSLIGDYSYPIYLGHWQCGLIASYILYDAPTIGMSIEGMAVFLLALLLVFFISFILINLVDKNISLIRNKIKEQKVS